jgi:hypothetical protein
LLYAIESRLAQQNKTKSSWLPTLLAVIQANSAEKGAGSKMAKARTRIIIRRAWTKDDVRQMKTMAKAKSGVKKISKALKRTPGATTVMAAKLGISLSMRD